MRHMIGVGPVVKESVKHFEKVGNDLKTARRLAVEE